MKILRTATTVLALPVAAGLLSATPAWAKSDLDLHADRDAATVGQSLELTAFGDSDDFGGDTMLLCIDEHSGPHAWRTLRCTTSTTVHLTVRPTRTGRLRFRAQLLAVTAPGHTTVDRTSAAVTVQVR